MLATFADVAVAQPSAHPDSAFVAYAATRAVPIADSARAFRSLDAIVAPARLIGVGESVHEVHEFLDFRLALLKDLVKRQQVTAVILEAGLAESMVLDDYVHGRRATLGEEVARTFGYGHLPDVQRTMQWIRDWNAGEGRMHPVSVYGADLADGASTMLPPMGRIRELLVTDATVVSALDALQPMATRLAASWWRPAAQKYDALSPPDRAALTTLTTRVVTTVARTTRGTRAQRAWANRLARVLQQQEVQLRRGAYAAEAPRDAAMAENTLWVLKRLAPRERAVLWAHNAHVQRAKIASPIFPPPQVFPSQGGHLSATLRQRYVAIGTAYGGASLDSATAPVAGSVDDVLSRVSTRPFVLPLRARAMPTDVTTWLGVERLMRFQTSHLTLSMGKAFDAVVWFDRVTPVSAGR